MEMRSSSIGEQRRETYRFRAQLRNMAAGVPSLASSLFARRPVQLIGLKPAADVFDVEAVLR